MKKFILAGLLTLFIVPMVFAAEAPVPVKNRCGHPAVLKTLLELMDTVYPSKFSERGAFVFDPDTILTRAYDENLDKVTCTAKFILNIDMIDTKKKPWAMVSHNMGIHEVLKEVSYNMQYMSGSTEMYNVSVNETRVLDNR